MGFEPTTSTLARLRSTTELRPRLRCVQMIIHSCVQNARLFFVKCGYFFAVAAPGWLRRCACG